MNASDAEPERRRAWPARQRRHDARLRVDRAPDVDGHVDERHVGDAEDADGRGELVRPGSAVLPDEQIADEISSSRRTPSSAARPSATRRPRPCVPTAARVTRPMSPKSTVSSAAATADAIGGGIVLEQVERARDAADHDADMNITIHDGDVEVDDLLHEPHRRLVRRARDQRPARRRTSRPRATQQRQNAFLMITLCPLFPSAVLMCLIRHQWLECPQRQRHEHHVEARRAGRST